MSGIIHDWKLLSKDDSGASFIEYTVLLGVILAVTIGTITAVGSWANGVWATLPAVVAP